MSLESGPASSNQQTPSCKSGGAVIGVMFSFLSLTHTHSVANLASENFLFAVSISLPLSSTENLTYSKPTLGLLHHVLAVTRRLSGCH